MTNNAIIETARGLTFGTELEQNLSETDCRVTNSRPKFSCLEENFGDVFRRILNVRQDGIADNCFELERFIPKNKNTLNDTVKGKLRKV